VGSVDFKQLHDELLISKPSGASHEASTCPFCAVEDGDNNAPGGEMSTNYTQDDINAAVVEATKPLEARIAELTSAMEQSAVDAKVGSVRTELDAKIAELQAALDSAVLEAQAAKTDYETLAASVEAEKAEQARLQVVETAKAARKEVASKYAFSEDYIAASLDRWAAMQDTDFATLVSDWDAVAAKREDTRTGGLPKETAMTAALEKTGDSQSVFREVMAMNLRGIDPRTL
jgi:hypothetical protein